MAHEASTAEIFRLHRYVSLPKVVDERYRGKLYRHALNLAACDDGVECRDTQVPGAFSRAGDPLMESLLESLLPRVEQASGLKLHPTYSYFRVYRKDDVLGRHTDRFACEISVTLCLGYEAQRAWPLLIEGPAGVSSCCLEPGDALLYRGIDCPHWRDAFEGVHVAQAFLHYVDQNGPYADWKFDKRAQLNSLRNLMTRT